MHCDVKTRVRDLAAIIDVGFLQAAAAAFYYWEAYYFPTTVLLHS